MTADVEERAEAIALVGFGSMPLKEAAISTSAKPLRSTGCMEPATVCAAPQKVTVGGFAAWLALWWRVRLTNYAGMTCFGSASYHAFTRSTISATAEVSRP
jgi:hypothetical protein